MKNSKTTFNKTMNVEYDGLTQRDLDNLRFLLSADKQTIKEWVRVVDDKDVQYALWLMEMWKLRCIDSTVDKLDESGLENVKRMLFNIGFSSKKPPKTH